MKKTKTCDEFILEIHKAQDNAMADVLEILGKAYLHLGQDAAFPDWCRGTVIKRQEAFIERALRDCKGDPELLSTYESIIRSESDCLGVFVDHCLHFSDFGFSSFKEATDRMAARLRKNGGAR